jgi:hypothetical protein
MFARTGSSGFGGGWGLRRAGLEAGFGRAGLKGAAEGGGGRGSAAGATSGSGRLAVRPSSTQRACFGSTFKGGTGGRGSRDRSVEGPDGVEGARDGG